MITLKYYTKASEVHTLCEMLFKMGYDVRISESFTLEVDRAVRDFQLKNNLISDGIVGIKTWQKLFEKNSKSLDQNDKFLSEADLMDFARMYDLEVAIVKAVNEIESSGKGFLINNKPKILFEGHIFWQQLKKRGIDPQAITNATNSDVLYPKWTKSYYKGGVKEYDRLEKAINISAKEGVKEAALASASWGCFQIMGFNALSIGYPTIQDFVNRMEMNEKEHLLAFGRFLETNKLIPSLREKNWARFARAYNGSGYAQNKYDEKLQRAYTKYSMF